MQRGKDQPPNILVIQVDEMRYPMHFPKGIANADKFLAANMPNLHKLWQKGVKFSRFYTAASDCTPARATSITGLYAYQTYMMMSRININSPLSPIAPQPQLQSEFPTYGKLLREAGYDTPYVGKWHLSNSPNPQTATPEEMDAYLDGYGFKGYTMPDPIGLGGAGVGEYDYQIDSQPIIHQYSDVEIAGQALTWLRDRADSGVEKPFCLSVNFLNPHDKQNFWANTEGELYNEVWAKAGETPLTSPGNTPSESDPDNYGYSLPDNWQSEEAMNREVNEGRQPQLHMVFRKVWDAVIGQVNDNPDEKGFKIVDSPLGLGIKAAAAPFNYWTRALDLYTQVMSDVDKQIGLVLNNMPEKLRENTMILFMADHGDYASSHGLQGKGCTVYEECYHIPMIFHDPSGRFNAQPEVIRPQFASSVDLLPLLVSLGHNGRRNWLNEHEIYRQLYADRLDLLAILQDPKARGRDYLVFTSDEYFADSLNYLHCPQHVLGLRTAKGKLGVYARWRPETEELITMVDMQKEYFDYATEEGRQEMKSTPNSAEAQASLDFLFNKAYPKELHAPLPKRFQNAQQTALQELLQYMASSDSSQQSSSAGDSGEQNRNEEQATS